ncbi:MAG: threonine--tRNA ligase [Pseudomonadota bacterium]|nr:threonine--tRNA ligase [Pseudomonadota bacterium]
MSNDTHAAHSELDTMRHSCAHVMAAAIQSIWPDAQFGVGPTIDNGFYYDVLLTTPLVEADLAKIETAMRKLRKKKHRFVKHDLPITEAISKMKALKQSFKIDLLNLLQEKGSTAIQKAIEDDKTASLEKDQDGVARVSFFETGSFTDLCRGPHVEHTGLIGKFKLQRIAGAYWRGDEKNPQLQRIYGLCFASDEDLAAEITRLEKLKERDHRRLGKMLGIYHLDETVGRGLPLWLPNGTVLQTELQWLAQSYERQQGYQTVRTPHLAKESLYYQSGHLPYYKEDMYNPIELDSEKYYLRPMNCPHHHSIYNASMHSYRDLPIRLSEWGQCYRYEKSGALNGLMRVRGLCINDAHIYCRMDQVKEEFTQVMRMHIAYYKIFDIDQFTMVLALPDYDKAEKYADDHENWELTASMIREAMDDLGYPYIEEEGEAAFYGPKIDFTIKSALGTPYTISTCQLDFMSPKRFNLQYRDRDGNESSVLVIHRAPLGTHERFIAFLLEHYGGNFPTWLAPVQICIIPIADRHHEHAKKVYDHLFQAPINTATGGLRLETDTSSERMQKKIRNAQMQKIPYMVVIGDQEVADNTLSVRHRSGTNLGTLTVDALLDRIQKEITERRDTPLT